MLSIQKIQEGLNCPSEFFEDFKNEVSLHVSHLLSNNSQAILSELAKLAAENGGIAELPINIKLPIKLNGSKFSVTGQASFERKYKQTVKMDDLQIDFNQPDLPFGVVPDSEKPGDNEKLKVNVLYDMAIDKISEFDKCSVPFLSTELKISFKRAAKVVDALEESGVIGPQRDDNTHEIISKLLKGDAVTVAEPEAVEA